MYHKNTFLYLGIKMFFVFEGTDGSGTSTQANLLAESLKKKGMKVLHTVEPTHHELGQYLRSALRGEKHLSKEAIQLLFFADRAEHIEKQILPALEQKEIVICERYVWSSIAYGVAEGVDQTWLENIAQSFLTPDYTFFLNLPAKISVQRIEERGTKEERFEREHILDTVKKVMNTLAERCAFTKRATVLDASESREQIFSRIEMVLTPILFANFFSPK
jgi:dTMP kinase